MLYRAKSNKDEGVFKSKIIGQGIPLGYELTETYFVDNSGFGSESEPALTVSSFLDKVKKGFYYGITEAGQFQVYIAEFKKVSRSELFKKEGIKDNKLISESCRMINYLNGDKTIKLYATDIVKFKDNKIILSSGGYKTFTTKARMNQFLPSNIRVYKKNRLWYIDNGEKKAIEFFDGIELII